VQVVCHEIQEPIGISEMLVRLSPKDDLVLAKQFFEFAPVILPPPTIERINHHLDDNNISRFTALPLSQSPSAGARVYAVRPPNMSASRTWL
jgi:hypothetical protein